MSDSERSAAGHWNAFWFSSGSATQLGLCRFAYISIILYAIPFDHCEIWASAPDALWQPGPVFQWLGLARTSARTLEVMGNVLQLALILAAIGLMTRTSCAVSAMLAFYLLGLRESFGEIYHSTATVPLALLTLAVARSGDACSIDSLLRRGRGRPAVSNEIAPGEYVWPLRLAQCLGVLVFFAAGIAKLRHSGLAWVFSDNMREILLGQHYEIGAPTSRLGLLVAEQHYLCMLTALIILAAEALAPLALVGVRMRAFIVPTLFVFICALPTLFGFSFLPLMAIFVFWIPEYRSYRRVSYRSGV